MLNNKVFYTVNDRGDGSYDFEEISFITPSQVIFREVLLNQDGSVGYDGKVTLPYSIENGNVVFDNSTPGDPSFFVYELTSMSNTQWKVIKNGEANTPYGTWLLSKPTNFPASL
jgi:hypothetical protein